MGIILNCSSIYMVVWQLCHIITGSRDCIWPVGAFSCHPFLLEVKQLVSQETLQQKACSFFWHVLTVQRRLHVATMAVASVEKVWKGRGWASAEERRMVPNGDLVTGCSPWLLSCLGSALARAEGDVLAEVSEQLLSEVAWGAWIKIPKGNLSSVTLGLTTVPYICSIWAPD